MKRTPTLIVIGAAMIVLAATLLYAVEGPGPRRISAPVVAQVKTAVRPAAMPTPTIGSPLATPSVITFNTATLVTVTLQIRPVPIAGGVNLLRLGATGTQPTILGVMRDDGLGGDAVASDGNYTLQVQFNEPPGQIQMQASVAFPGALKRMLSSTITILIWDNYSNPQIGTSFEYPPVWTVNNASDSVYFTNGDIEVLDISTAPPAASLSQFAQMDIATNNCLALDVNNNPVDHVIAASATGVLYVLSCSATSDDYNYIFLNLSGQVVKLTYHDDFDPAAPEVQQLATFQKLISTVTPH